MGVCDPQKMKRNLLKCGQPALSKGVEEIVYLGMKSAQSIAFTYDPDNSTIVTGIGMAAGEKLFAYEGANYSNALSVGFAETEFDKTLPQQAILQIFTNSPEAKQEVEALLRRKDVILISKREGGGPFEIWGAETGMRVSGFTYEPNADNKGTLVVTLSAADETSLPKTLIHKTTPGGVEDTKTYLTTLVLAAA
jgi:hypothetical protein